MKKLLSALLLAPLLAFSAGPAPAQEISSAPLYGATLHDLDDKPVALSRYRGKPLVVNFWARWCAPCRAEIPELIKFRQAHQGKIEVLGIGIEDDAAPVKEFARDKGMNYPVFVAKDKGFPLMQALGDTQGMLPYTLFVDGNGKVVLKKMGQVHPADLEQAAPLLLKP